MRKPLNRWLASVNIIVEGTHLGAATDLDGRFFIINVPPGEYDVSAMMIGYQSMKVTGVRVSVNRTATVEFKLQQTLLETEIIVVEVDKMSIKKDQTSSIRNISSKDIEVLPVESVNRVVAMQPGVVQGHFRGGCSNEVSYLIDGLRVDEAYTREVRTVSVETDVVQEVEVITGTFNAEYGQAMSGVVNVITKDGSEQFHAKATVYGGDYLTDKTDLYFGLKRTEDIPRNK